ncbi:hypothetical protein [Paenibacillus sp. DS2015]|uniref:hypothetical protein n=1 Tax=Paenibacillus sp. DS2015 TaxID=3373917 RepID=UPI003D1FE508
MTMEELMNDLQGQKTIQADPNHISLENLFNEAFMSKYSSYKNFDEFLIKGNFQVKTEEDVNNIPDELFDRHVNRETKFANWESMLETANKEYQRK